ncbi:MAG: 3'-5' exonuclease [Chitinophagales bacterium]|nr:MAG: 3'-5' exonuclease [Chitinophagales bacterium]
MLDNVSLENLLVIDIETVPQTDDFKSLPGDMQELWGQKVRRMLGEGEDLAEHYFEKAGIYAEFGMVVCISAGFFRKSEQEGRLTFKVKSFASRVEKQVLTEFKELLDRSYNMPEKHALCGHNIKEFDVPYLCRRMLINGLELPKILDLAGRKPWEVQHVDTMQLWKFGDVKNYTSLKLLATVFNLPTPKDDIDGSDVARVFWKENDLARIVHYCQKDVIAVAQLFLKFKGLPLLKPEDILYADNSVNTL